jgi:hypothetical protein
MSGKGINEKRTANNIILSKKNFHSMIKIQSNDNLYTNTERVIIDYPVKIHWIFNCKCKRVLSRLIEEIVQDNEKIICVLEKLWCDNKYERFRKFTCIKIEISFDDNRMELSFFDALFSSSMELRKNIINYFRNYQWLPTQSETIRKNSKIMNSICLCRDNLTINELTSNAGFVIIGTKNQMMKISHCFNKYVTKTEFSSAYYVKLKSITNINKRNMDHTLIKFSTSKEYILLKRNPLLYTIVGLKFSDFPKKSSRNKYGLPFGKREWCYDVVESSFDCARRELYEELNIQFSLSLWKYNENLDMPKQIYIPGFILYTLYLSNNALIGYHGESDTIYLDKINYE